MPNTQVTIYLTDEDYVKYAKDKEKYNEIARIAFKKAMDKEEK